jgi:hypothetical protein
MLGLRRRTRTYAIDWRLAVGSLAQEDLLGLYGAFPERLEQIDGGW